MRISSQARIIQPTICVAFRMRNLTLEMENLRLAVKAKV